MLIAGCGGSPHSSKTQTATAGSSSGTSASAPAPKPPGAELSVIALDEKALTVTLPLHKGATATGAPTYYIVTDASSAALAKKYGVNRAPKLILALGTRAGAQ